jgi:hypothetical protein
MSSHLYSTDSKYSINYMSFVVWLLTLFVRYNNNWTLELHRRLATVTVGFSTAV